MSLALMKNHRMKKKNNKRNPIIGVIATTAFSAVPQTCISITPSPKNKNWKGKTISSPGRSDCILPENSFLQNKRGPPSILKVQLTADALDRHRFRF